MRFDSGIHSHAGVISNYPPVDEWLSFPKLLESCGFTGVWCAEHHFFWDGWATPTPTNPLLYGAYIASATKNLRIGQTGVCLPDWHPIRAAEDAAMLDHMSGGRLDFGFMPGVKNKVSGHFNPRADRTDKAISAEVMWEAFEVVKKAWSGQPFRHEGKYFKFPYPWRDEATPRDELDPRFYAPDGELIALEVVPTPFQKPLPPCWLAADSVKSTETAARAGVAAINWAQTFEGTREVWTAYRQAAAETAHTHPLGANRRVAMMRPTFVAKDSATADAVMRPALNTALGRHRGVSDWLGRQAMRASYEEPLKNEEQMDWFDFLKTSGQCFVGSPEDVTELLKRYETELGAEHLILFWALPGLTHQQVRESVKLFADKVMPHFSTPAASIDVNAAA